MDYNEYLELLPNDKGKYCFAEAYFKRKAAGQLPVSLNGHSDLAFNTEFGRSQAMNPGAGPGLSSPGGQ